MFIVAVRQMEGTDGTSTSESVGKRRNNNNNNNNGTAQQFDENAKVKERQLERIVGKFRVL
jgi:hypothetical protein